jgi:hypothetical protein
MQAKASVDMLLQCSGDNAGDLLEPEDYDVIGGANEPSAQRGEIALVLQGGGALSAYEYGIILGTFDAMDAEEKTGRRIALKAVTAASVGTALHDTKQFLTTLPKHVCFDRLMPTKPHSWSPRSTSSAATSSGLPTEKLERLSQPRSGQGMGAPRRRRSIATSQLPTTTSGRADARIMPRPRTIPWQRRERRLRKGNSQHLPPDSASHESAST